MNTSAVFISLILATVLGAMPMQAAAQANADQPPQTPVFGQSLMSPTEIADFKSKLLNSASAEERKQIETEHHDRMVQRARWKGLVLPQPGNLTVATSD
jgi:arylsulfatase A-like enzyme